MQKGNETQTQKYSEMYLLFFVGNEFFKKRVLKRQTFLVKFFYDFEESIVHWGTSYEYWLLGRYGFGRWYFHQHYFDQKLAPKKHLGYIIVADALVEEVALLDHNLIQNLRQSVITFSFRMDEILQVSPY